MKAEPLTDEVHIIDFEMDFTLPELGLTCAWQWLIVLGWEVFMILGTFDDR